MGDTPAVRLTAIDPGLLSRVDTLVSLTRDVLSKLGEQKNILDVSTLPVTTRGQSTGAPLTAALTAFRGSVVAEVLVRSSGAAIFTLEASIDGITFRTFDTIVIPPGGGTHTRGYLNAYPVLRVSTLAANDNIIEISMSH